MTHLAGALVDLVLPRGCVGCGRSGAALCPACRPPGPPVEVAVAALPVTAATTYDGAVRLAVLAYKERGRRDLARPLSGLLAEAVSAVASDRPAVLVPVPSAPRAARARGGDHVHRLARLAGRQCGVRVVGALRLARPVSDSAGLGAADRLANLHGAMAARAPDGPGAALVVDDITTTGATLREAVRSLRIAGWQVQGGAVIAAATRRW
jgi:predicted amidophosphoribosyltransferase